jgi:hypothetical protein
MEAVAAVVGVGVTKGTNAMPDYKVDAGFITSTETLLNSSNAAGRPKH